MAVSAHGLHARSHDCLLSGNDLELLRTGQGLFRFWPAVSASAGTPTRQNLKPQAGHAA